METDINAFENQEEILDNIDYSKLVERILPYILEELRRTGVN